MTKDLDSSNPTYLYTAVLFKGIPWSIITELSVYWTTESGQHFKRTFSCKNNVTGCENEARVILTQLLY